MAQYKHGQHLTQFQHEAFDTRASPGTAAANAGIYRCAVCGDEIGIANGHTLASAKPPSACPGPRSYPVAVVGVRGAALTTAGLAQMLELGRLQPEFEQRGVKVIVLSSDGRERAQAMADKLKAADLRKRYDLGLANAREWGLYVSTSRGVTSVGIEVPALFSEPGVFIVRPDGTLYYGAVQTMPFARPHFDELLAAVDFALAKNYPARGEYAGAV